MTALERVHVLLGSQRHPTAAFRRGVELARRSGARLQLCRFEFDPLIDATADLVHPEVQRLARTQYLKEAGEWLEHEAAALAARGLRVDSQVTWAPVTHEALLACCLEHEPGLVIKDVQRQDGVVERLLFTPEDWRLMRLCPAPLMLVQPESGALPARVVAAVDVSIEKEDTERLNTRIADSALQLGLYAGAEVHVAHVFPYEPRASAPYRELKQVYEDVKQDDARRFGEFCDRRQVPADRRHLLQGEPATTLGEWVRGTNTDLVVMGTVYRNTLDRFFLGSTAENLLNRVPCDVLLVKPADFLGELGRHVDLEAMRRRYTAHSQPESATA